MKNIVYKKFKIASYLTDSKFNIDDKILLFSLRTRMVDVKCNFKNGIADISCSFCDQNEPQTQQHLMVCPEIFKNCPEMANNHDVDYSDLFKDTDRQLKCVRLFRKILNTMQKMNQDDE